jgi:hypothetical protein
MTAKTQTDLLQRLKKVERLLIQATATDGIEASEFIAARKLVLEMVAILVAELPGMPEKNTARGTREEVIAYCVEKGLAAEDGEWFFDKNEGCGWKLAGRAIANWRSVISAWKRQAIFPSQKQPFGRPPEKSLLANLADVEVRKAETFARRQAR